MSTPKDAVWYLRVAQERLENVIVLTASGRVSSRTFRELESALAAAADSPVRLVVLDLSQVDYISSPGLRAVMSVSKRLTAEGRRFVVCGLHDAVRVAFTLGGLGGMIVVEPSRDAAIGNAYGDAAPPPLDTSRNDV